MAMSADLGPTLEAVVNALVSSGRYNSKSEVLREGVRLVQEREARLKVLDAAIEVGIAAVETGQFRPAAQAFDELEAEITAIAGP